MEYPHFPHNREFARLPSLRIRSHRSIALCLLGAWSCRSTSAHPPIGPGKTAQLAGPQSAARVAPVSTTPAITNSAAAATAATTAHVEPRFALHGSLSTRARFRHSGDANDTDVYSVLALDAGETGHDRTTAHLLARVSADVDGRGNTETQQLFGSLQDTYGEAVHVDVYEASVEFDRPFDAELRLRAGRQFDYATPEFAHYDGARVETLPSGKSHFVAGAFAGVPVRLYDATSIGDQIAGVWTEGRPWSGGRVRADWMHVNQSAEPTGFHDDLLGLSAWQRVGTQLLVDGGFTRLEDENRDVRLRATWDDGHGDLLVQAGYYRLLNPIRAFALEFDPFFTTLQEYEPYSQYRLLVSKSLGAHVRVDLGGDLRQLESESDEGRLNHDYEREYATLVVSDVLTHGLDLSVTGDNWNSNDRDVRTWGVDATWAPDANWRASIGSSYSLYEFDVLQNVERDDVRIWYAKLRKKVDTSWSFDLAYEYEDDAFDDFHEVIAGATWRF